MYGPLTAAYILPKNPKINISAFYDLISSFSTLGMGLNHVLMIFSESRDDFRWNMLFSKNFSTFMVFVWILRENPQNDPFLALTKGKKWKIGKISQKSIIDFFHLNPSVENLIFRIFENIFFQNFKKIFFDEKKKFQFFLDHYIDVKFSGESIFRILGAI